MSSSGTATGLGAVMPAKGPVSSRELHVAPIANARREGCYLVAAFRAQLERRASGWRTVFVGRLGFGPKVVFFEPASRRWQDDLIFEIVPRELRRETVNWLLLAREGKACGHTYAGPLVPHYGCITALHTRAPKRRHPTRERREAQQSARATRSPLTTP